MEIISLKALARKVLNGNTSGNNMETEAKNNGNFSAENVAESFHIEKQEPTYSFLSSLFLTTLERIQWTKGLMVLPEVQKAEAELELAWRQAEVGEVTIEGFKNALKRWERIITTS